MVAPPLRGLQVDVVLVDVARKHRRKQHAVIGKTRLFADDRDRITPERLLRQFFDETRGGHAVSDDDERFAHGLFPLGVWRILHMVRSCI